MANRISPRELLARLSKLLQKLGIGSPAGLSSKKNAKKLKKIKSKAKQETNFEPPTSWKLTEEPISIDIGYLPGESHRNAFANIFSTIVKENADIFQKYSEIKTPIGMLKIGDVLVDPEPMALNLYDLSQESITIELIGIETTKIQISFDNPEFCIIR